jgi:hypothetical protein
MMDDKMHGIQVITQADYCRFRLHSMEMLRTGATAGSHSEISVLLAGYSTSIVTRLHCSVENHDH